MLILASPQSFSQSLFESSQIGIHEDLVSSNLSLGGFIRSVSYFGESPENDRIYLQSVYAQAGFLIDARAGDHARATADIRIRYGTEFGEMLFQTEIREANVDLWAGPFSIRLGKMITPWGKGTVFNPVDKLTPTDPTVRSPIEDDMRLGSWGIQSQVSLGPLMRLEATWKPLFQPSVLLIDPVPMPDYVDFTNPVYPGMELSEGSYGIEYALFTSLADLSLYWFDGYHNWPGIGFESFSFDSLTLEPRSLILAENAYRIRMAGLDLSIPFGAWIIRGEGAWMQATEPHETTEYLPFPELSYTAELEWSSSHFNLLAGYYGKTILDYAVPLADASLSASSEEFLQLIQMGLQLTSEVIDEAIRQRIGSFNRLYNYQIEEHYHSLFLVGKGSFWDGKFALTVPLIYHLTTSEWIVQPSVEYKPLDGLDVTLGYSGLYGPENSLMDLVGPVLNALYLSVKLTF
jgi:hypothetical protein